MFRVFVMIGVLSFFLIPTKKAYSLTWYVSNYSISKVNPVWGEGVWWSATLGINNESANPISILSVDWFLYDNDGTHKDLIKTETTQVNKIILGHADSSVVKGQTWVNIGDIYSGFENTLEHKDTDIYNNIADDNLTLDLFIGGKVNWQDGSGAQQETEFIITPEPSTLFLLGIGLFSAIGFRRMKLNKDLKQHNEIGE